MVKRCSYPNGQGATGFDYTSTPPSGGGGGFCGGHDSLSDDEVWPPIADSGSSYAKECLNDYDEELCFFNIEMKSGVKEGDGSLIIKKFGNAKMRIAYIVKMLQIYVRLVIMSISVIMEIACILSLNHLF